MPSVLPPSNVLVTGANGYLATWICRFLLEHGYAVKGAVRSDAKGAYMQTAFAAYGTKFEYIVVPDMSEAGAFDAAVEDVDAVLHTAARATSQISDPTELIGPNVRGVLYLLESVTRCGTRVRRFVYTSTTGVLNEELGSTLDEDTAGWNEDTVREVETKQAAAPGHHIYLASKVLAEQAALRLIGANKDELMYDFVSILAPWLIGPQIQAVHTKSDLTEAMTILDDGIRNQKPAPERYAHMSNWADVRDVALAHVLSLQKDEAGGERFIISAGAFSWQDIYDALNSQPAPLPDVPLGDPTAARGPSCILSSAKAERILDIHYKALPESIKEAIVDMRAKLSALEEDAPTGVTTIQA